jgi:DNA-binding response OmpR family regulator
LLVEDEGPVRELARQVLTRHGYRVIEAADGAAALRGWEENSGQVDLLFSDVVMPGELNGKALALCLTQRKPGLPVLLTSGYSADLLGEDVASLWRDTLLRKPYHPRQLLASIRACLDRA